MLQALALRIYQSRLAKALLRSRFGERVFQRAYFVYKSAFEAREIAALRPHVMPDAWVIDVGANIGFFTIAFAGWVRGGKVLAIEPEPDNFRRLQATVAARGLAHHVDARRIAVADQAGRGHLIVSPDSHADHRLGDDGEPVTLDTLDNIWIALGQPDVSLVKIDVQGAEMRVLAGGRALLAARRPALYVEIDTEPTRVPREHAPALLALLDRLGYKPAAWRTGGWTPLSQEEALAEAERSAARYADLLFRRG